ncbi:MAG: MBL fold metallo-hydrolase [Enterocloster aldenensis]
MGTIIYTHGHPDHRGGAGAFSGEQSWGDCICPKVLRWKRTGLLKDIQNLRGYRQFGYG